MTRESYIAMWFPYKGQYKKQLINQSMNQFYKSRQPIGNWPTDRPTNVFLKQNFLKMMSQYLLSLLLLLIGRTHACSVFFSKPSGPWWVLSRSFRFCNFRHFRQVAIEISCFPYQALAYRWVLWDGSFRPAQRTLQGCCSARSRP